MLTMDQIRQQYPSPERLPETPALLLERVYVFDAYCVGGAVCRAADFPPDHRHFPQHGAISAALQRLNPALDSQSATTYATDMSVNNDDGLYERAWQLVDRALTYTRKETPNV